ncbi:MAG: hypothetical protein DWQ19_10100 [Crenarchaeota archaeon]|nr:MAG: hypothetical protein DWQ19_10100 [Thermoproteota archaeon]
MKTLNEYRKSSDLPKLLFEARQKAHNDHLASKSYAEHKALDSFYTALLDLADDFIETYQGQYGLIDPPKTLETPEGNTIQFLENFASQLKSAHKNMKDDTHLQNIVDEIVALTYRTIYKLKNLK